MAWPEHHRVGLVYLFGLCSDGGKHLKLCSHFVYVEMAPVGCVFRDLWEEMSFKQR